MKAGKEVDMFPRSYQNDPLRPQRYRWPPGTKGQVTQEVVPTLQLLSPGQSAQTTLLVDVRGTDFTPNTIVLFNGTSVPSSFVSNVKISATFTSPGAGTYPVKVSNSAGDSNVKTFQFN